MNTWWEANDGQGTKLVPFCDDFFSVRIAQFDIFFSLINFKS